MRPFYPVQDEGDMCGTIFFHYIFLEFLWNNYFIFVRYKFYSIQAPEKLPF